MLAKIFIKDKDNTTEPKVRYAYGVLASIVGIVANTILSIAKIVVGVLFGSVAVLADGINNLTDAGSSIVTALGFRIANKPADKDHPFGHARVEYVASLVISFIVLLLGIEIGFSAIEGLVNGSEITVNILMMSILGVSIIVKIAMFAYFRHIAIKIDSKALKATSVDSLNDAIATTAVLISSLIIYFTGVNIDGYMGLIVAIFIFIGGIKLFKDTVSPLLGETPSREFIEGIANKIRSYDGVLGVHDLVVHNYGYNRYYVSVHVEVDASRDIMESHDIIDNIEREFASQGIDMVIHLDPVITDDERVNRLKDVLRTKLIEIDGRLDFHDFRVVWRGNTKKLIFDIVLPFESTKSDEEIVNILETHMREYDPTCTLVVNVDRHYLDV